MNPLAYLHARDQDYLTHHDARSWPLTFFKPEELQCKGSGGLRIQKDFGLRLDLMRKMYGFPITVTSGYRSRDHNRSVGGATNSYHLLGRAADLAYSTGEEGRELLAMAVEFFGGIGVYRSFIHVDNGPRRIWTR